MNEKGTLPRACPFPFPPRLNGKRLAPTDTPSPTLAMQTYLAVSRVERRRTQCGGNGCRTRIAQRECYRSSQRAMSFTCVVGWQPFLFRNRGIMEIKEILEAVQVEGAGKGDVVFIALAPTLSAADFSKFAEAFGSHANAMREGGEYFPRCIVMPPGVTVEVARAQVPDRIEITSDAVTLTGEVSALSPDPGFPHA
jgi:hypothetical protein